MALSTKAAFNSQVTLVNPESPTELIFAKPSAINTTILLNGKPYLKVSTVDSAAACTTITDVRRNEVLVTIQHRTFQSDIITFANHYEGKAVKLKEWLLDAKTNDGRLRWIMNSSVSTFVWCTDVEFRLVLCPETDLEHPIEHPIAWAKLQQGSYETPHALMLTQGTDAFVDEIVASYCILEQRLKMREKEFHIANGKVAVLRTVLGTQADTGKFNYAHD